MSTPHAHQSTALPWPLFRIISGEVLGCAAKRPCLDSWVDALRKAEVGDFDVSEVIEQQILGLQVTEDDVLVVKMLESEHNGRGVESSCVVREAVRRSQMREELSADNVLKNEIQMPVVLERPVKLHDERETQRGENVLLSHHVFELLCP